MTTPTSSHPKGRGILRNTSKATIACVIISMTLLAGGISLFVIGNSTPRLQTSDMSAMTNILGDNRREVVIREFTDLKVGMPVVLLNLSKEAKPGHAFVFEGIVRQTALRWDISFLPKPPTNRIYYYFFPLMDQKIIIRNTFDLDSWGTPEQNLERAFPFKRGAPFSVKVELQNDRFVTSANGTFLFNFHLRFPNMDDMQAIRCLGDVDMMKVTILKKV